METKVLAAINKWYIVCRMHVTKPFQGLKILARIPAFRSQEPAELAWP